MNPLPNGVKVPTGSDFVSPQDLLTELANSFSDAIGGLGVGKRQPRRFGVANQSEKDALAGATSLIDGDEVFVADTAWWELRIGGAWVVNRTTRAVAWPFAHTGIDPGTSPSAFTYTLDGERVRLRGSMTFTTAPTITAGGALVLPFARSSSAITGIIGSCSCQFGSLNSFPGYVMGIGATTAKIMFLGDGSSWLRELTSTVPTSWGAGASLTLDLTWKRAL